MLNLDQKAAAWDKAPSQLTDEELLYVDDPISYEYLQQGCFDLEKLGRTQHQSKWIDVENKAKIIVGSNRVTLIHKRPYDLNLPAGVVEVYGNIIGDRGRYEAKILLPHPKSRAIRSWSCACTWGRYAWDRRPIYKIDENGRRREVNKKFEGRVCSHILALWWVCLTRPVEYEDVEPSILQAYLPEMINQDMLEGVDWEELRTIPEKDEDIKKRVSPREMSIFQDIDIGVLNKSIQGQFDLVTGEQVVAEIERLFNAFLSSPEESAEAAKQELLAFLNNKNVYDTDETIVYKKEIAQRIFELTPLKDDVLQLISQMPTLQGGGKLRPEDVLMREQRGEQLPPQYFDADGSILFWKERFEYEEKRNRIFDLVKEISRRTRSIQGAYDANLDSNSFSNMKAEDVFKEFHWWEVNDRKRGRDWVKWYMKSLDPKVIAKMIKERIKAAGPGGAWAKADEQRQQQQVAPQPQLQADSVLPEWLLFDETPEEGGEKTSSVTILSSDVPIKDIVVYLQQELTGGGSPKGFVRKELWGEQRGGLVPHPDAIPLSTRPDGNFVYSPDDLGFDPETGMMGCDLEDRGTYGAIPVGGEVVIMSVDPKNRMVFVEYGLDNHAPNHSHIHLWIPLKDIDLI